MKKSIYKVQIITKSPLFVGEGLTYSIFDYIDDDHKIYLLDLPKIIHELTKRGTVEDYLNELEKLMENIGSKKMDNIKVQKEYKSLLWDFFIDFKKFSYRITDNNATRVRQIETPINDKGIPYIPGSSIKGAILGCAKKALLSESEPIIDQAERQLFQRTNTESLAMPRPIDKSALKKLDNKVNELVKLFRKLSISDAYATSSVVTSVVDVVEVRYKGSVNEPNQAYNNYEVIQENQTFECYIDLTNCNELTIGRLESIMKESFEIQKQYYLKYFQLEELHGVYLGNELVAPIQIGKHTGLVSKTYYAVFKEDMSKIYSNLIKRRGKQIRNTRHQVQHGNSTYILPKNIRLFKNASGDYHLPGLCSLKFEECEYEGI